MIQNSCQNLKNETRNCHFDSQPNNFAVNDETHNKQAKDSTSSTQNCTKHNILSTLHYPLPRLAKNQKKSTLSQETIT
jgi:hypothetical protein